MIFKGQRMLHFVGLFVILGIASWYNLVKFVFISFIFRKFVANLHE